jgi:polyribonucleotide nucleotidyltransferase
MGDQLLVKVISVEGNKVRLSRKAVLRDQRAKTGAKAEHAEPGEPADPSKHSDHHASHEKH